MKKLLTRLVHPNILTILLLVIAFLFSIHRAFFLTQYPAIFVDESWYSNAIWNNIENNQLVDSMHQVEGYPIAYANSGKWPRLGTLPYQISFELLGLGLWQGRLVSWIFGFIQLIVLFVLGNYLFGPVTGAVAVLFLALDPTFVENSVLIRPEGLVTLFTLISYWLYRIAEQRGKTIAYFFSGLIMALTLDIHPNGALFSIALASTHFLNIGKAALRARSTWLLASGAAIGVGYYVMLHPNNLIPGTSGIEVWIFRPPILDGNLIALIYSFIQEFDRFRFEQFGFNLAVIVPGLIYAGLQKERENLLLIIFLGVTLLEFALFTRHKGYHYAGLFLPFLFLLASNSLIDMMKLQISRAFRAFILAMIVLFVANNLYISNKALDNNRAYDYSEIANHINLAIPPEAKVMAQPVWWLALNEHPFSSALNLTYLNFYHQFGVTEGLLVIRPDYILVDNTQRLLLSDSNYFSPRQGFDIYLLPKQEFVEFLDKQCVLVDTVSDEWHGEIEIYHVLWPD